MVKKLQALKAKKGFTLVELIVVIAIIGVLAAILVPVMMNQVEKAKITSLDSTASTVVEAVNAWIADRYTNGVSGGATGKVTATGGTVDGTSNTNKWDVHGAATDNTSLTFALKAAYNFADTDYIAFWFESGKCVAAVYKQNAAVGSSVAYSSTATPVWTGVSVTNEKDGIVCEGGDGGPMVGTYPKCKSVAANP